MINNNSFQKYLTKFQKLRQGNTAYGKAPHKPVLLLAVISQMEKGHIKDNHIYLTPDLVAEFIETFKLLVHTGNRPEFTLPFYHLTGEGFWHLMPKSDQILMAHPDKVGRGYVKSINVLNELVDYAYLDAPLFALMNNLETRQILKHALLNTYFDQTKALYLSAQTQTETYIHNLEKYILNEPSVTYQTPPSVKDEDERFVRGSLFKKWIPKLYNQTCSITRMRVTSTHGYQLIDACHIKPISLSNDDTVSNGFALCPNLHRAFDRGIMDIDEKYRVVVSRHFKEAETLPYSLKALAGTPLYLPMPKKHFPKVEHFLWHLGERFER
jgi:putative restriction endonuclease